MFGIHTQRVLQKNTHTEKNKCKWNIKSKSEGIFSINQGKRDNIISLKNIININYIYLYNY